MKKTICGWFLLLMLIFGTSISHADEGVFAFESTEYQVLLKQTITLKPVAQGINGKLSYSWMSSDPNIAKVQSGKVSGTNTGTAEISCIATSETGKTYEAKCTVNVLQPVTKIAVQQRSVELPGLTAYKPEITIEPENASIKDIEWTSSNTDVVHISDDGSFHTLMSGKAVVTGKAKDGSGKTVKITITVPRVYVTEKNIKITEPEPVEFGYQFNGNGIFEVGTKGDSIRESSSENENSKITMVTLTPVKAGTSSIYFYVDGDLYTKVKITVAHSAVYDKVSCPATTVKKLLTDRTEKVGSKVSLTGEAQICVQESSETQSGTVYLRSSDGYFSFSCDNIEKISIGTSYTVYGIVKEFVSYTTETGLTYECPVIDVKNYESK